MKNLKKISLVLMCLFVWSNFASAGKQAYTSSGQKGGAKTTVVRKKTAPVPAPSAADAAKDKASSITYSYRVEPIGSSSSNWEKYTPKNTITLGTEAQIIITPNVNIDVTNNINVTYDFYFSGTNIGENQTLLNQKVNLASKADAAAKPYENFGTGKNWYYGCTQFESRVLFTAVYDTTVNNVYFVILQENIVGDRFVSIDLQGFNG